MDANWHGRLIQSITVVKCNTKACLFLGLLLIFGIFFAWETRKVKIEALNDSQQIGICVYNVMVMSVVAVPLVNILSESQMDIVYGVTAMAILICVTTTLVLVFGSKVIVIINTHISVSQQYYSCAMPNGRNCLLFTAS